MCLSIAVLRPDDVLAVGKHAGFEWIVVKNEIGFRCGYVKVEPGHPWFGKAYGDIDVDVHGGLTFSEHDMPCDAGGIDDGYWIGFDCAHGGDAPDPALATAPMPNYFIRLGGEIRTQKYVEAECRSLCEQAWKIRGRKLKRISK